MDSLANNNQIRLIATAVFVAIASLTALYVWLADARLMITHKDMYFIYASAEKYNKLYISDDYRSKVGSSFSLDQYAKDVNDCRTLFNVFDLIVPQHKGDYSKITSQDTIEPSDARLLYDSRNYTFVSMIYMIYCLAVIIMMVAGCHISALLCLPYQEIKAKLRPDSIGIRAAFLLLLPIPIIFPNNPVFTICIVIASLYIIFQTIIEIYPRLINLSKGAIKVVTVMSAILVSHGIAVFGCFLYDFTLYSGIEPKRERLALICVALLVGVLAATVGSLLVRREKSMLRSVLIEIAKFCTFASAIVLCLFALIDSPLDIVEFAGLVCLYVSYIFVVGWKGKANLVAWGIGVVPIAAIAYWWV